MTRATVDLRSDTVTRPGPAMRQAIAAAPVGDDVLGDDPTVKRLEAEIAGLAGFEGALFVPSGTMGNQVAIHLHCRPGEELLAHPLSPTFNYEAGGAARFSGVQIRCLPAQGACWEPGELAGALRNPRDEHQPLSRLLLLENTHNLLGGRVVGVEAWDRLADFCLHAQLRLHVDGARLWNAAVVTGAPPARLLRGADSAMLCLSKGLGAPVGSLLLGSAEFIDRGRRVRKAFGGGMRQSGLLAAAGLQALAGWEERLAADHRRARALAEGLARVPGLVLDLAAVETNMIYLRVTRGDAARLVAGLEAEGVLALALEDRIRLVTHSDVTDEGVEQAIAAFAKLLA